MGEEDVIEEGMRVSHFNGLVDWLIRTCWK
jgi:hypothetical protein